MFRGETLIRPTNPPFTPVWAARRRCGSLRDQNSEERYTNLGDIPWGWSHESLNGKWPLARIVGRKKTWGETSRVLSSQVPLEGNWECTVILQMDHERARFSRVNGVRVPLELHYGVFGCDRNQNCKTRLFHAFTKHAKASPLVEDGA